MGYLNHTIMADLNKLNFNTVDCIERFKSCEEGTPLSREPNHHYDRYYNVLPGENSIHVHDGGCEGYINANKVFNDIVVTQAPCPRALLNFWLMVAQNNVCVIVMLTNICEGGRIKADVYWPPLDEKITWQSPTLSIKTISETKGEEITTREFVLTYCGETRNITQYHHTTWRDHDVPPNINSVVDIMEQMRQSHSSQCTISRSKPPHVLIHCSAGIGRTGTVALGYQIARTRNDPIELLKELRRCRPRSVESVEQFAFALKLANEFSQKCKGDKNNLEN